MKVVIIRNASIKTKKMMAAQFPENWEIITLPVDELENSIGDADAIIPEGAIIDRRTLALAPRLKLIQTGAGYDNIDIEACTENGIYVANAAGVNALAVAEHVFAFILAWHKNIIALDRALKSGQFNVDYVGSELSQKVIGVVGLGNIGRVVCRLATAFGMKIFGYHHRHTEPIADTAVVELHTLLKQSDIITLHVALNGQTHHLIGQKEFKLMKKDAFLINTSRGGVVDEAALIESLRKKQIGGAGLDVYETEPLPAESPLRKLKNVILSPHNAGEPNGLFFHKKRFRFFAENISRVLNGKPPRNALNDPVRPCGNPNCRISPVELPEGYNGKILLLSVKADGIEKKPSCSDPEICGIGRSCATPKSKLKISGMKTRGSTNSEVLMFASNRMEQSQSTAPARNSAPVTKNTQRNWCEMRFREDALRYGIETGYSSAEWQLTVGNHAIAVLARLPWENVCPEWQHECWLLIEVSGVSIKHLLCPV